MDIPAGAERYSGSAWDSTLCPIGSERMAMGARAPLGSNAACAVATTAGYAQSCPRCAATPLVAGALNRAAIHAACALALSCPARSASRSALPMPDTMPCASPDLPGPHARFAGGEPECARGRGFPG